MLMLHFQKKFITKFNHINNLFKNIIVIKYYLKHENKTFINYILLIKIICFYTFIKIINYRYFLNFLFYFYIVQHCY